MPRTQIVHSDPDILGGKPVFVGTRVPLQALLDYIEGAHTLNEFLADFKPGPGHPRPRARDGASRCRRAFWSMSASPDPSYAS